MSEIKHGLRLEEALQANASSNGGGVWRSQWADHAEVAADIRLTLDNNGYALYSTKTGRQRLPYALTSEDIAVRDWCAWE